MLKLADENSLQTICDFCKGDLIGTKIACYCLAYGFDKDFFSVWINTVDGEIKAVISEFYDSVTLKAVEGCEAEEITGFCSMLSYADLVCDSKTRTVLQFSGGNAKKSYLFRGNAGTDSLDDIGEEYYNRVYKLVCENIPGSFADTRDAYLSWLSDFTYRNRRGLSRCKGVIEKGAIHSSVITSSESDTAAVLSAVATSKEARGKGYGKATVLAIINELMSEEKDVYVIALNESAEGFYEHIGFEFESDIYFYRAN